MLYIYPFVLGTIYWLLDSYYAMQTFHISFFEALVLDYPQANPLIRIFITLGLFGILLFHNKKERLSKEDILKEADDNIKTLYKVSDITLSALPAQKKLNEVAELLQNDIQECHTVFIGSFEKDSILIQNKNDSLAVTGVKGRYYPYQEGIKEQSLEEALSLCYIEKREWIDTRVTIRDIHYRAVIYLSVNKKTKAPLGILGILCDEHSEKEHSQLLEQTANQLFFSMELEKRKNEALEAQNLFTEQLASYDKKLNIANVNKIQEFLGHEIKRAQRYKTDLTLILINIDHIKNLTNVFPKGDVLTLKQEFTKLFKKNIRDTDLLGKWSDDTFVIVAPNIDFRAARGFIKKLNTLLREFRFSKVGKITCSYGVTSFAETDSIGEFRKRAESALEQALQRGTDSVEVKILVSK